MPQNFQTPLYAARRADSRSGDVHLHPIARIKPPKLEPQESVNQQLLRKGGGKPKYVERKYQTHLYLTALKENVIIYLGTGLGKTFVVVLFLNSPYIDEQIQLRRKVAFLATTQDLTKQQAEYINEQVPYKVKIYCGRSAKCGEHIDHWNEAAWQAELSAIDILFMTPQIFTAAISTGHIKWTDFSAVIFDEVHHGSRNAKGKESNHAYVNALKHYRAFYASRHDLHRPRLIGLTASLINTMPKNRGDIKEGVKYLENLLFARCITDLDVQDKRPETLILRYAHFEPGRAVDILINIFETFRDNMNAALKVKKASILETLKSYKLSPDEVKVLAFHNRLKLAAAGFSIKPGSFPKVFDGLNRIRKKCGLWMLRYICTELVDALGSHSRSTCLPFEMKSIYIDFREIILNIHNVLNTLLNPMGDASLFALTRRKPKALLEILKQEYSRVKSGDSRKSSFSCIVFVNSRLEVKALTKWLQTVSSTCSEYSFLKCDYAIGIAATMASKYSCITKRKPIDQFKMLKDFRAGDLNTIITTSVLEEGIDLPVCSTVVRYDTPNNFRQYVQSRGRARQEISSNIFICPADGFNDQVDMLRKFNDFELTLKQVLGDKDIRLSVTSSTREPLSQENKDDFFWEENSAFLLTPTTAKTILSMYCNYLSKDTPYTDGVKYERVETNVNGELMYQTILYLPANCRLSDKGVKGQAKKTTILADNSAIVAAVKLLYLEKELNQYGAPTRRTEENVDKLLASVNLEPKFEKLDPKLEGIKIKTNDGEEITLFKPLLGTPQESLFHNFSTKVYKLMRVAFVSESESTREDTRKYFEKPVFGLIVDSSIDTEFIPSSISSHYGQFKVIYKVIQEDLSIKQLKDHIEYLNYTHRFLTRCLSIYRLSREEFREHCLFYIVPLDSQDKPDIARMHKAFYGSLSPLVPDDIVKLHAPTVVNDRRDSDRLMLVRAIRSDMNVYSRIPESKNTFIQDAEFKGCSAHMIKGQRIIEVAPISKEFGSVRQGKKTDRGYTTNSLFYIEQFLQRFDNDPYSIFQAYLMPEILYRLYLTSMASLLDRTFRTETAAHRSQAEASTHLSKQTQELNLQTLDNEQNEVPQESEDLPESQDSNDSSDESIEGEEENDDFVDATSEDTDDGENDLIIGPDYKEMITKRTIELNHDDDNTEEMQRWDLSEYKVDNLEPLNFKVQDSTVDDERYIDQSIFTPLDSNIACLTAKLVSQISKFEQLITADSTFLDENSEFEKRNSVVDKNIIPPIIFDRASTTLRQGSRIRSLLEALTQRKAQDSYNLEGLENVGDSYLKYVVSVVLFNRLDANEGFMTSARSRLTGNKYFTHLAKKKNLGSYAITNLFSKDLFGYVVGKKLEEDKLRQFYNRMRPKALADTVESIIGSFLAYHGEFEATLSIEWLGLDIFDENTFSERHEECVAFSRAPTAMVENPSLDQLSSLKQLKKKFHRFEKVIGYEFQDSSYLVQAFTHASSVVKITRSYERLEFLGDAILDLLVTKTLLISISMDDPGQITSSRSALVNNYQFARLAMQYKYDLFIQHFSHDLYDELTKVRLAMEDDPEMQFLDMVDYDRVAKLLGDVFESVAAAIYLDSGCSLDTVWNVYYPMMKKFFDKEIEKPTKNLTVCLYETFPGPERISFEDFEIPSLEGNLIGVRCRVIGFDNVKSYRDFEGQGLSKHQAKLRAIGNAMKNPPSKEECLRLNKEYNELYKDKFNRRGSRTIRGRGGARGGRGGRTYNNRQRSGSRNSSLSRR